MVKNNRRRALKKRLSDYKGGKCEICGYTACLSALTFHHLDKNEKDFNISNEALKHPYRKLKKEVDKCILLCSNCHIELHEGLVSI